MSDILELEKPLALDGDDDGPDTIHYYCDCSPHHTLCGRDASGMPDLTSVMDTPEEDDCVVCVDLIDMVCPRCGER